jgi:TRAP-type uncharacterized transport system fused permease subunit
LAIRLSEILINFSGGNLFLLMVLTMVISLILGMGLPTSAVYIILAIMVAPAMMKLGVGALPAHMFIFYFGVLADVTPPVALAAYAAAGIAGSEPMRTGFTAFRLSMGKALVPFMFVYAPSLLLLDFSWREFIEAMLSGMLGITALSAAYTGWFRASIGYPAMALLTVGGIALIFNDWRAELFGAVIVLAVLAENELRGRRLERAAA